MTTNPTPDQTMTPMPEEIHLGRDWVQINDKAYIECYVALPPEGATPYVRKDLSKPAQEGWIKTTDRLPAKPGLKSYEYVDCLIYYKGEVLKRPWNCEHLCWDDEHYDDHFCDPTEPSHWMPLPPPPTDSAGG